MLNKITLTSGYSNNSSSVADNPNKVARIKYEIKSVTTHLDVAKHLESIPTETRLFTAVIESTELRSQILACVNEQLKEAQLNQLYLQRSSLTNEDFTKLTNLKQSEISYLDISSNEITKIPDVIFEMPNLRKLNYLPNEKLRLTDSDKQRIKQLEKVALNRYDTAKLALKNQIEKEFAGFNAYCSHNSNTWYIFQLFGGLINRINTSLLENPEPLYECKELVIQHVISSVMNIYEQYDSMQLQTNFLVYLTKTHINVNL